MKVTCYCQHLLGIGHLRRSLEICRALAVRHPTTLVLGGPPLAVAIPGVTIRQLPGLRMDEDFTGLIPCEAGRTLTEVKAQRQAMLQQWFAESPPDLLLTELYPFGRKAFRFELEPLLTRLHDGSLHRCLICCSVRDILVEKNTGQEKFEEWVVATLNNRFDGILVHADPRVITLDETFGRLQQINIPLHYTGFVAPAGGGADGRRRIRTELGLTEGEKLIVASIGGGSVGGELLLAVAKTLRLLREGLPVRLQLFTGPYCPEDTRQQLARLAGGDIHLDSFTDRFPDWLEAADLSISMAGYNTVMNLLRAGVPGLVHPFQQNREQRLRAERLARHAPIAIVDAPELEPDALAGKIRRQLACRRHVTGINLDGAAHSVQQLEAWQSARAQR